MNAMDLLRIMDETFGVFLDAQALGHPVEIGVWQDSSGGRWRPCWHAKIGASPVGAVVVPVNPVVLPSGDRSRLIEEMRSDWKDEGLGNELRNAWRELLEKSGVNRIP